MEREHSAEGPCLKSDDSLSPKDPFSQMTHSGKNRRIESPLDQFQTAVTFCEVEQMPVIPGLKVAFVDLVEADPAREERAEMAKVRNRQQDILSCDAHHRRQCLPGILDVFQHVKAGHDIERPRAKLAERIGGIERQGISQGGGEAHAFRIGIRPRQLESCRAKDPQSLTASAAKIQNGLPGRCDVCQQELQRDVLPPSLVEVVTILRRINGVRQVADVWSRHADGGFSKQRAQGNTNERKHCGRVELITPAAATAKSHCGQDKFHLTQPQPARILPHPFDGESPCQPNSVT